MSNDDNLIGYVAYWADDFFPHGMTATEIQDAVAFIIKKIDEFRATENNPVGIPEKDLEISMDDYTVEDIPWDGQTVNTNNGGVKLTHIPSDTVVIRTFYRSRLQNLISAWEEMKERVNGLV